MMLTVTCSRLCARQSFAVSSCSALGTWSSSFQTLGKRDGYPPMFQDKQFVFDTKSARKFAKRLSPEERQTLIQALVHIENPVPEDNTFNVPRPDRSSLWHLAFNQALPFIGFGFLDNLIMILAGEYIDHNIGITLGISTMAAAALGNTISDLFGIGSAWYVEHWASRLGVSSPSLTLEQLELPVARLASTSGRAVGVVVGCLLGMAPLMFQ